jgi:hypothetical protein
MKIDTLIEAVKKHTALQVSQQDENRAIIDGNRIFINENLCRCEYYSFKFLTGQGLISALVAKRFLKVTAEQEINIISTLKILNHEQRKK